MMHQARADLLKGGPRWQAKLALIALAFASGASVYAAQEMAPVKIVATPDPVVFPRLLALGQNPALPVHRVSTKDGAGMPDAVDILNSVNSSHDNHEHF